MQLHKVNVVMISAFAIKLQLLTYVMCASNGSFASTMIILTKISKPAAENTTFIDRSLIEYFKL